MSCITELLKMKKDNDFLRVEEGLIIEGGGEYKGYEYIITFIDKGHRCGYVAIDKTHPCYGKNLDKYDDEFKVHGGITFHNKDIHAKKLLQHPCDDEWLGFDAMHVGDCPDVKCIEKYFSNSKWINIYEEIEDTYEEVDTIKTYEYMEAECKSLIDQLLRHKRDIEMREAMDQAMQWSIVFP